MEYDPALGGAKQGFAWSYGREEKFPLLVVHSNRPPPLACLGLEGDEAAKKITSIGHHKLVESDE